MQQEIIIATISIVIATLIVSPLLTTNVYAHGVWGKTVILYDNQDGHSKGWDPNDIPGSGIQGEFAFRIFDPDFNPYLSTVLINIRSEGSPGAGVPPPCGASSIYSNTAGVFRVFCNFAIEEGSELHYTLFNMPCPPFECPPGGPVSDPEVDPTVIQKALKLSNNITQGIEGGLSLEQQQQLANVTGADGR